MGDPVYDFLNSGGSIPKAAPAQESLAENDDPVHNFLASGGSNIKTVNQESKGYFQRVYEAGKAFNESGKGPLDTVDALGEGIMQAGTAGPVSLLKHGVEEGAYLSGQSPEQAQNTAQRVIPTKGYQPVGESGKALSNLASTVAEPLVDAGKWAAEKAGLSPAAQNIAGDFAPVVILKAVAAAPGAIKGSVNAVKAIPQAASDINAQFKELQRVGRGETPQVAAQPEITPQMARGQESLPEGAKTPPDAPKLTPENASPELKKTLMEKDPQGLQQATQRHLEADSLPIKMRISEGQATGDIHKISDEWNSRAKVQEYGDLFNEQNGRLIDNTNAIRERAAPDANGLDHVENGEALIDSYKAKDAAVVADISAKYKALEDANGGQFPLDGKSFVDGADAALAKKLKSHYVPPEVRSTLNDLRDGGKMTFEDFETLRSDLAETARSATDGKVRSAAGIIRDQLEDMPMPEGAEHLKPLADAARSAAKSRFAVLDKDPAYKAAVTESTSADKFVQKFVVNGNKADLAEMRNNLIADPIASQNIAAAAINYLKTRAGIVNDNGNFSQAGYNKALAALKPKLDYLFDPITAQQIQTLGKVARYVKEQPSGSAINNSNTLVAALKGTAGAAIGGALNVKTLGLSGAIKGAVDNAKTRKATAESLKPGAGVKISDIPKG